MTAGQWVILGGLTMVVGYIISLEMRLRSVQSKLVKSQLAESDATITSEVKSSSDAALDADLSKRLGRGADSPPKT